MISWMIFITGGTGFIGSRVVEELSKKGRKLYFLTRKSSPLTNGNVFPIFARLDEKEKYSKYLKNSKVLLHIAGCAKAFAVPLSEFYYTNYLSTKTLINEALKNGVKKVIHISTCMVFGPSDEELCEDDFKERKNFLTPYEESKYLAEVYLRNLQKNGAPIIILYPTRVFGEGKLTQGNSLTKLIYLFMKYKILPAIDNPDYYGNYVYINDVVNIVLKAVDEISPPANFLVGGYNLTLRQLFEALSKVLKCSGKIIVIRKEIALLIARFCEALHTNLGIPAPISRGWVKTFSTNWLFSNKKVKSVLNYTFTPLEEALERTIKWLNKIEK
jgi:nucleoside-diphosphate-sugar epimerase